MAQMVYDPTTDKTKLLSEPKTTPKPIPGYEAEFDRDRVAASIVAERRIVQISAYLEEQVEYNSAGEKTVGAADNVVVALCNDGSVWRMGEYGAGWQQLPAIPQAK